MRAIIITKKAEYAIFALVELAKEAQAGFTASSAIAERRGIPANLIGQTMSALRRSGWVEAQRGVKGGVRLVADPARLTLREVIEAIDGPVGITRCLAGEGVCSGSATCRLRGIWADAQAKMLEVLDGVTIDDLTQARS